MNDSTDVEESFSEYKRAVRGRASEQADDVREALSQTPSVTPMQRSHQVNTRRRKDAVQVGEYPTEHSDYVYGAAAQGLENLLGRHEGKHAKPKLVQFGPRVSRSFTTDDLHSGSFGSGYHPTIIPQSFTPSPGELRPPLYQSMGLTPSPEEVLPLLQNQTALLQQLENEKKFLHKEMHILKQKISELTEENRALHEELKHSVIQEILHEGVNVPGVPGSVPERVHTVTETKFASIETSHQMAPKDYIQWQRELERISAMHVAKAERLEYQLKQAREDMQKAEREIEDMKSKLRIHESLTLQDESIQFTSGICLRCAQNDAILPGSYAGATKQAVDRLTKERDELMDHVNKLHTKIEELRQREEDAYQQVKKSVELVEAAQMEQTQALVEKEQAKEEIANMRSRLQEHIDELHVKMNEERELVRSETKAERDELHAKLKEVSEVLVATQLQMEKLARDKASLQSEVEAARNQISSWDADYGRATDSMKVSMTSASIERKAAVQEAKNLRKELARAMKDHEEEKHRLKTELDDVRRRLMVAERDLVETKEECISMTNTIQALERDLHLAKLAKDTVDRTRTESVKAIQLRAEQREMELNTLIDQMEVRHNQATSELEEMVSAQTKLVQKLRGECHHLASQLEDVTVKFKQDNKHLKNKCEQLSTRLERALSRQHEMEAQNIRHAELHEKMRGRLRQMDGHSQHCSQQILELLAKESSLMRDRQLLAKEVEFLRQQLTSGNESDAEKLYYSGRGFVDDILVNVRSDTIDDIKKPSKPMDTAKLSPEVSEKE